MLWLIGTILMSKETFKITDDYYKITFKGKAENVYVANVIKGEVKYDTCKIPIMNILVNTDGKIEECIYKPTKKINEFEVVIYYRR